MEQQFNKKSINIGFTTAINAIIISIFSVGSSIKIALSISSIVILWWFIVSRIYKKISIPFNYTRIIESIVIISAPLIIINKYIIILFLLIQLFVIYPTPKEYLDKIVNIMLSCIPLFIYVTLLSLMVSDRFLDYRILIVSAYYLWSIFYIWKLQVVEYKK